MQTTLTGEMVQIFCSSLALQHSASSPSKRGECKLLRTFSPSALSGFGGVNLGFRIKLNVRGSPTIRMENQLGFGIRVELEFSFRVALVVCGALFLTGQC